MFPIHDVTTIQMSPQPRQHRADLAGSLAARTTMRRHLEILYGLLIGLLMWIVDAVMHAQLQGDSPLISGFLNHLFGPGMAPSLFRTAFLVVSVTLGWMLWRANLKREAGERQKFERALAGERLRTMLAVVNTFNHDLQDPLVVIANDANALAERAAEKDQMKLAAIAQAASRMSTLITQLSSLPPLYVVDVAGVERLAPQENFEQR